MGLDRLQKDVKLDTISFVWSCCLGLRNANFCFTH